MKEKENVLGLEREREREREALGAWGRAHGQ